ncbi:MAG TPA: D-alanine--D-alanine ligase [Gemmatimonadaceae bacterium]|nr:D-alanine--D-alanine ligase [Gemmatimonadaceae bacterium]
MKITVLLGGTSSERNVSLASGLRVCAALRERGHRVTPLDPAKGVLDAAAESRLAASGVGTIPPTPEELQELERNALTPVLGTLPEVRDADVVFLALHGGQGEDGTIQAVLDLAGVPYTGSGRLASALAMDKDLSKTLFRAAGVNTADWVMTTAESEAAVGGGRLAVGTDAPARRFDSVGNDSMTAGSAVAVRSPVGGAPRTLPFPLPVVVKPSKQGSTVGLTVVKRAEQLEPAIVEALRHDDEVMIERFVAGREFTVGILGDDALPVGEIIPAHEIYDYECKYTPGMAREVFPAELPQAAAIEMQRQARLAFRALKLRGYARIDFRMTDDFTPYCLEANTLPGMTELSLIPQGAAAAGISFPELCERIAKLAVDGGTGDAGRGDV